MTALETAIGIAAKAHAGQTGHDGQPYILHPLRVMLAVEGENERIAAVLHDVLEKSHVTVDQLIAARIPAAVVRAVIALTRPKDEDYGKSIERAKADPIAQVVKVADVRDKLAPGRVELLPADKKEKFLRALQMLEQE